MPDEVAEELLEPVCRWLQDFEKAVSSTTPDAAETLFQRDGYWRDLLAFTWNIQTIRGAEDIAGTLLKYAGEAEASQFQIDLERTPPRLVTRAGQQIIEAIFSFKTAWGAGSGVVRLDPENHGSDTLKAWTLLTALEDIKGTGDAAGGRQHDKPYARDFSGPNWFDDRQAAIAFVDREPDVLVVGAGQAGLSIAAQLTHLNVETLVVDQEDRIGDNWRNRYHALSLHNQVHVNHFPGMPFPPNWPTYIPKDKLAGWFETYVESMELNCWTGTKFAGGSYDERAEKWSVELPGSDGHVREMHPKHVVMATGASGIPNLPEISGLVTFTGSTIHSSDYGQGSEWSGKNALVFGTGTSGHDIAQDLFSHGANVTLVQRNSTMVLNVEPSAQLPYTLYGEGLPLADSDLIAASMPFQIMRKAHQQITERIKVLDKELLDGLSRAGFRTNFGWDESGWQFKYLERGGGYYFNVGCSDLVIDGKIGLVQLSDIEGIVADGARMRNGEMLQADLIVFATGYKGQDVLVRQLFGDDIADRVGPIWGFDPEQHELRNMFVRTGQPGLWFIAGSFAQCRIYSKFLGLQIKACEEGLIPPVRIGD
jgi:cation diffusion facilitator CzcD-associated flavoprotein CzcO